MLRILISATIATALLLLSAAFMGVHLDILFPPSVFAVIVVIILGTAAVGGHLHLWPHIISDLGRASGAGLPSSEKASPAALLAAIRSAAKVSQVGGALNSLFFLILAMQALTEPPEIVGPLLIGAFVSLIWGLLIAHLLFEPMSTRLAKLYDIGT